MKVINIILSNFNSILEKEILMKKPSVYIHPLIYNKSLNLLNNYHKFMQTDFNLRGSSLIKTTSPARAKLSLNV